MTTPGHFLMSESLIAELQEEQWDALFDSLVPNKIVGQTHFPEHGLIRIELEGPEIEPGTEYEIAFTDEEDGSVTANLNEIESGQHAMQVA